MPIVSSQSEISPFSASSFRFDPSEERIGITEPLLHHFCSPSIAGSLQAFQIDHATAESCRINLQNIQPRHIFEHRLT